MPHTREPRCNHCNNGRRRVKAAPYTIHRMNSKCNPRITSANAECILLFCTRISYRDQSGMSFWQMKICGHLGYEDHGNHVLLSEPPRCAEFAHRIRKLRKFLCCAL